MSDTSPCSWSLRHPLRISFLGFNPLGDGYDGRGKIDRGADRTFSSLEVVNALRFVRRYFDINHDGRLTGADGPPFDLRITGYSFGGWSALQLVQILCARSAPFQIRIGLVDPVNTFRPRWPFEVLPWRTILGVPVPFLKRGLAYASRPQQVVWAENYLQTKGLIARYNGTGFRLPMRASWFASQPIEGFINHDVSAEVSDEGGHVDIAEKFAERVATQTFDPT